jgi:hypothetical protein
MTDDREPQSSGSSLINQNDLRQFMEKVVTDLGGTANAVLVYVGDKPGLNEALYDAGKTHNIARAISYDKKF